MAPPPPRSRGRRQRTATKHYTDDDPATFTTKGCEGGGVIASSSLLPSSLPLSPFLKRSGASKKRKRPSSSPDQQQQQYYSITHTGRCRPIVEEESTNSTPNNVRISEAIFGRGLGPPPVLPKPHWQSVVTAGNNITCIGLSADESYLVLGHATGQVTLFTATPRLLAVATIRTLALVREEQKRSVSSLSDNNQHHHEQNNKVGSRKYGKQRLLHDHEVELVAIAMSSAKYVVLATRLELECWDAETNTCRWTLALDENQVLQCHALDIHSTSNQILASTLMTPAAIDAESSPLCWLDDMANKITFLPIDKEGNSIQFHTKCTAIWDKSRPHRFLVAGAVGNSIMLLLIDTSTENSTTTTQVVQQVQLPHKMIKQLNVESLVQSPNGSYTLVGSTRGIRLLETDTLATLQVYGDNFSLHGHSIIWQTAFFLTKQQQKHTNSESGNNSIHTTTTTRTTTTNKNDETEWRNQSSVWIVGVPNRNRPPAELHDVLHIWDVLEGKHVAQTMTGPNKCGGFTNIVQFQNGTALLAAVKSGECVTLQQTFQTDFAGIMYPPGYHIIDDNLEYIEDEDECDIIISPQHQQLKQEILSNDSDNDDHDDVEAGDLAMAMRLSILEQQQHAEEAEDVDILHDGLDSIMVPCRPDMTRQNNNQTMDDNDIDKEEAGVSPSRHLKHFEEAASFLANTMKNMPHWNVMLTAENKSFTKEEPSVDIKPMPSQTVRQKRTKAATLEALRRASLNPKLRKTMIAMELWTQGKGSSLQPPVQQQQGDITNQTVHVVDSNIQVHVSRLDGSINSIPKLVSPLDGEYHALAPATKPCNVPSKFYGTVTGPKDTNHYGHVLLGNSSHEESTGLPLFLDDLQGLGMDSARHNSGSNCIACRGRWVIHTCGKRIIPVDYDEVKRAEEEQKYRQEEELKKERAAKRKVADAKRRIMKKKKRAEEEAIRIKKDDLQQQLLQDERKQEAEYRRQHHPHQNKEQRRAEMLERLQHVMDDDQTSFSQQLTATEAFLKAPIQQEHESNYTSLDPPFRPCHLESVPLTSSPAVASFYQDEPSYQQSTTEYSNLPYPDESAYISASPPVTTDGVAVYEQIQSEVNDENAGSQSGYEQETYSNAELLQAATYTTDNATSYSEFDPIQGHGYSNDSSVYSDHQQVPAYHDASASYSTLGTHAEYSYQHSAYLSATTTTALNNMTPSSYSREPYGTPPSDQMDAIDALAALASVATSRSLESSTGKNGMTSSHQLEFTINSRNNNSYHDYNSNENHTDEGARYLSVQNGSWENENTALAFSSGTNGHANLADSDAKSQFAERNHEGSDSYEQR